MWVDEQIWGHRLWDSTSPWLILLECLSVAEAKQREADLMGPGGRSYPMRFRPAQRMYLRNILYNNEALFRIAAQKLSDAASWDQWVGFMNEKAQGVPHREFSYLRRRFSSFSDFAALVDLVRSSTIEAGTNRRWSSRFVFPFGANSIYEDLNVKDGSTSREYINFGLPGELLYQMLCRSSHAEELAGHLRANLSGDPIDRLVAALEPDYEEDRQTRKNSFLPYASHDCFDDLARDWLAIFSLQLPRSDVYPHLARLAALHLLRYKLVVAAETADEPPPAFVCEILAPRRTPVRELSIGSFQQNDALSAKAVNAYLANLAQTDEWRTALSSDAPFQNARRVLIEKVRWPGDDDYPGPELAEELLASLRRAAQKRHRAHVALVHRSYGGGAGLVSKRGTNQLRYAPSDALLRTLILANVGVRMDYNEFLELLFERYGLVISDREAARVLRSEEFDRKSFQVNAERLERRLRALGKLRRLSDACAYVENPGARTMQ
ncbi:hypothetical protein ASF20_19240 [Methylobacterium sp. Leaf88]|nr:hypothetical protein ASF20_19240 [Methylobacterium sp. Leaf88]